jgi:hypothetical protein
MITLIITTIIANLIITIVIKILPTGKKPALLSLLYYFLSGSYFMMYGNTFFSEQDSIKLAGGQNRGQLWSYLGLYASGIPHCAI